MVIHQHLEPTGLEAGAVNLRNVFSDRHAHHRLGSNARGERRAERFRAAVLALQDAGADVSRVGDALGPRSFEEAIAEGTRAALGVSLQL